MSVEPGQLINDKVRLLRLLGRGGMGSVWVARHEGLDVEVAVKFIATELLQSDSSLVLARFRREAQLAAKLDNPHTVRVLDHGITRSGAPYIVMELLRGESLAERLQREHRVPVEDAVRIVRDVADGLDHAHALGIVHRDIKPPNIFLSRTSDDRSVTKILDFGIAKSQKTTEPAGAGTSSGTLIGTPHYMSPEQLMRAGPPDKSADVWALAVVAYEIIIGKPPFIGETLAATLVAITQAQLSMPTKLFPSLSPALDRFFGRALSVDPQRRYPSARALAEAFASAADGTAAAELPTLAQPRPTDATMPTAEFLRLTDTTDARSAPSDPGTDLGFAPTQPEVPRTVAPETPLATARPTTRRAPRRTAVLVVGAGAIVAGALALWSVGGARDPATSSADTVAEPAPVPSSEPSQERPALASTLATTSASAAGAELLGMLSRTSIPDGFAPLSSVFVPAFEVAREEGDEGASFLVALRACERRSMSLCTESQWQRACEEQPLVGTRASWTLTPDERGVAVRGGAGCGKRAVSAIDATSPDRIGMCCTRSVGMTGANKNKTFLLTTSGKILNVEGLFNSANGSGLAAIAATETNAFGVKYDRVKLAETVGWYGRSGSYYFDVCDAVVRDVGELRMWSAMCSGILTDRKGNAVASSRLITFGDGGLLQEIREPKPRAELRNDDPKVPKPPSPKPQ